MKRTPFLGPILWRPTIVTAVFLVQNLSLKAEKQIFTSYGFENFTLSTTVHQERERIDTFDFSWVENDRFYPFSPSEDSIYFGLALEDLPALPSVAPLSIQADTVHFEWKTSGKSSGVYLASLFI